MSPDKRYKAHETGEPLVYEMEGDSERPRLEEPGWGWSFPRTTVHYWMPMSGTKILWKTACASHIITNGPPYAKLEERRSPSATCGECKQWFEKQKEVAEAKTQGAKEMTIRTLDLGTLDYEAIAAENLINIEMPDGKTLEVQLRTDRDGLSYIQIQTAFGRFKLLPEASNAMRVYIVRD